MASAAAKSAAENSPSAAANSPSGGASEEEAAKRAIAERAEQTLSVFKRHIFLSVMQHCISMQSEPMLITKLSGGDAAEGMRALANSQGLMGALSLMINQAGGRLSDSTGRRLGLLLGPALNIVLGSLVYANPTRRSLVLACRVIRMIATTFSNTVMTQAALVEALPSERLGGASAEIGAYVGGAVVRCCPSF